MKMRGWLMFALVGALCVQLHALSPFQTVAGVGGPMPGATLNCYSVFVSSVASTQILASNIGQRMGLYMVNVSTNPIIAGSRGPIVWISSYAITAPDKAATTINDLTGQAAWPVWPADFRTTPSTSTFQVPSTFGLNGNSIWQGAVYGLSDSFVARMNACELLP